MKVSKKRRILVSLNSWILILTLLGIYTLSYEKVLLFSGISQLHRGFCIFFDLSFVFTGIFILFRLLKVRKKKLNKLFRKYFKKPRIWKAEKYLIWIKIILAIILLNEVYISYNLSYTIRNLEQTLINRNGTNSEEYLADKNGSIQNSNIYSVAGRYSRTIRWKQAISKTERKYDIPTGLLAGLIMQESMGNPLQLNSRNDGGAGLMMFQPGTAASYGLKIYGSSRNTGRDIAHGKSLRKLIADNEFDYVKLSEIDHRFHIEKSIMAGGKFLSELNIRYGNWHAALSAYNRGKPAPIPINTKHVRMVLSYQKYYLRNSK